MTETRRAFFRIASNYLRLIGTVLMGLLIVRLLLRGVGAEAVGLVSLLGSTMGLATVIEESVENSMVRELGRCHHAGDITDFRRVFNSALLVSFAGAVCSVALFGVVAACLPLLSIDQSLLGAAYGFVAAKAVESCAIICCSPIYNMYLAQERMLAVNGWLLARRSCALFAAGATLLLHHDSPSTALIWFGWVNTALHVLVLFLASGLKLVVDKRLRPALGLADRSACFTILKSSGTNAAIYAAQLLQVPACSVLMNLVFGLHGNFVFGIAVQAAGYVRMVATGFVAGTEAITTRFATEADLLGERSKLQALAYHATRLQAFVSFPAAAGMFVIAPAFIHVWLAGSPASDQAFHEAALLTRVLVLGILAQCILDVWWRMLYGAGVVHDYARPFAMVAICTAPAAWLLIETLPASISFLGPSIAYSGLNLVLAAVLIPRKVISRFEVPGPRLASALLRPIAPSLAAAAAAFGCLCLIADQGVWSLGSASVTFGLVFAAAAFFAAIEDRDRERLWNLASRMRQRLLSRRRA